MTTLKLPGKSAPADSATHKPVRRGDPAKRSRLTPPVKATPPAPAPSAAPAAKPRATEQSRPARTRDAEPRPYSARQPKSATPDSRQAPARGIQIDGNKRSAETRDRPSRGNPERQQVERRQPEPGRDERSPFQRRAAQAHAKDPAQGRDTPRRGGKVRDGFEQGSFNQDRASNPMFAPKPVASQPDLPRLSKRMAELGLCSRREADEWIVNGWVKVDGAVVDTLGTRISPDANIEVSKQAQQHQSEIVTILLNKPVGYVSGQAEDGYEPAIVLIHPDNQWEEDPVDKVFQRGFLKGLAPAGRLDIDSTGLLVLTQDGRVARQLIGEDSTTEKEYLVRVEGELSEQGMRKLNHGLTLDGVELKPAKVSWQNEDQLRFVLREGRKRQIRRMCELVGLHVVGLKRVRIGSVTLGKLPPGQWRYLRQGERF
ncbi:pseudouridine synthase [Methylobacillus flagellatus]|uniref:pseudouridine synthase n=1 Tax=Methylobacillus flagellatus TaxID=405 RepID=UPI0010F68369|nr:pseudouridine synthase [Methylobacillus flagellatus]